MPEPKTILLVDDDRDVVLGVSARLRAAGYDSITVRDAEGALATAIERQPDAIVLDVRLPGMDGMAALKEFRSREETRHIPVVMLSASLGSQQAALDNGAKFFLSKPFEGSNLLAALNNAVNNSENRQQGEST